MLALAQTRALAQLLWRFWARRGLVGRRGAGGMRAPGLALRALFLLVFAHLGYTTGHASRGHPHAIALLIVGLAGYLVTATLAASLGTVRGLVSPLQAPLLDALPLHERARVALRVVSVPHFFAAGIVAIHSASPSPSLGRDVGVGALFVASALLAGIALSHVMRTFVSPMTFARATVPVMVVLFTAFFLFLEAPYVIEIGAFDGLGAHAWPLAATVVGGGSPVIACAALGACAVASSLVFAWAEQRGFDRIDAVPTKRYARAAAGDLTLGRIDWVLTRREPGSRAIWVAAVYVGVIAAALVYGSYFVERHLRVDPADRHLAQSTVLRTVASLAAFMAFSQATVRASRAAERDLVARPLLAPLPIAPADLLDGKARAIRRQAMIVASPLALLVAGAFTPTERLDVFVRVGATIAAAWLAAGALVSVAFLTSGVAAGPRAASSAPLSIDRFLVFFPMLSVATAPSSWVGLVSLASLALLATEARRSARLSVRWLDDEESFARETAVWRALLVLAGFTAVQGFAGQIAALTPLPAPSAIAIVYVLSAIALVALTARERGGLRTMALRPERRVFLAWAAIAGFGMMAFVKGYSSLLPHLGVEMPASEGGSSVPLGIMAVVVAPLAEEVFFRGWLQETIAHEHASRGGAFAVVVTSFAFAATHPPVNFVPALLLGLVAGTLARRSGAIGPGIVVHAMMNAAGVYLAR